MNAEEFKNYLNKNYLHTSSFLSGLIIFFVDAIVLFLCIVFGFFIANFMVPYTLNFRSVINYSVFLPFLLLLYIANGLYPSIMIPPTEEIKKFAISTFVGFAAIVVGLVFSDYIGKDEIIRFFIKDSYNRTIASAFLIAYPFAVLALPTARVFARRFLSRHDSWGVPSVVYIHGHEANIILDKLIKNKSLGYHPAVIIDSSIQTPSDYSGIPVFPEDDNILKVIKEHNVKVAIITGFKGDISKIMQSYRYTITVSENQNNFTSTQHLKDLGGIIGFSSTHNLTFKFNLFLKRLLDIFLILLFSPVILPVFIILSILVKITSKGPIFYGHVRVGKNNKKFKCWKFRSMCINSQEILEEILATDPVRREEWERDCKFVDDPRITKFGKFLRKTSLDELPQLINILVGQMSFVGPRPVTEPELEKYGKARDYVLSVLPGLSGMWQVSGRSDTSYEDRIAYDSYYIQNWSIWLDIWILIKTVWVVLKGKGAY